MIQKTLSFVVRTECAHSGEPLALEIDSLLRYRVSDSNAGLRIFVPLINVSTLKEPSIIDSF